MVTGPKISVVIPSYNRLHSLTDTLEGLRTQSLDPCLFEVIVIDNGSSDGTFEAISGQARAVPFDLRVFRMPGENRGPAPARNQGVEKARGEVIAFTDSDCRPHPKWLEQAWEAFRDDALAFATGPVEFKPEQVDRLGFFSRRTVTAAFEHPTYPTANAFYRRSVYLAYGGFQERLSFPDVFGQAVEAADTDLAWRIKDDGGKNAFLPDAVIYHEVQNIPPKQWLLEPVRLFLVPALVKLHPAMRGALLAHGLFFFRGSPVYYLALAGFLALLFLSPWLLLWLPAVLIVAAAIRIRSLAPSKVLLKAAQFVLNAIRIYVMSAALVYGSIRFGSLVL